MVAPTLLLGSAALFLSVVLLSLVRCRLSLRHSFYPDERAHHCILRPTSQRNGKKGSGQNKVEDRWHTAYGLRTPRMPLTVCGMPASGSRPWSGVLPQLLL